MPSKRLSDHYQAMDELRPHQDEFLQLANLAGIQMDQKIFRGFVQMLNMGVNPEALYSLLKTILKRKLEGKSRRSGHVQRRSVSKK